MLETTNEDLTSALPIYISWLGKIIAAQAATQQLPIFLFSLPVLWWSGIFFDVSSTFNESLPMQCEALDSVGLEAEDECFIENGDKNSPNAINIARKKWKGLLVTILFYTH